MKTIRAFIAIDISQEAKDELSRIINIFKKETDADIKWVRPENIHLTLKFLGNIDPDKAERIAGQLNELKKEISSFNIEFDKLGVFPDAKRPRVVWAGIGEGKREVEKLAEKIETLMEKEGFEREKREFKAHLTIGRVKRIKDKTAFEKAISSIKANQVSSHISKVILYKSTLTPQGAVYEALGGVEL